MGKSPGEGEEGGSCREERVSRFFHPGGPLSYSPTTLLGEVAPRVCRGRRFPRDRHTRACGRGREARTGSARLRVIRTVGSSLQPGILGFRTNNSSIMDPNHQIMSLRDLQHPCKCRISITAAVEAAAEAAATGVGGRERGGKVLRRPDARTWNRRRILTGWDSDRHSESQGASNGVINNVKL